MRKFAAVGFAFVAALLLSVGLAQAVGDDGTVDEPMSGLTAVQYEWWGDVGELRILAEPGQDFEVFDATGTPIAGGFLAEPCVALMAPNHGFGPDGAIIRVRVGQGEIIAVTDPEWEWD